MRTGSPEYLTKSWDDGGRMYQSYIVMVSVPGDDLYEVGIAPLRKLLGVPQLTPELASLLTQYKPHEVSFTGQSQVNLDDPGYSSNNLVITEKSAQEWFALVAPHLDPK